MKQRIRSTTVLCVRRDNKVVMAGDGQVTLGNEVLKTSAKKLRRIYNDKILTGFAGSTADAFALFARFESKLEQFNGNLSRAAVELAKDWRTDRMLRHLEALLLVADDKNTHIISGNGDVIEPDEGAASIGSGGPFALSAATALLRNTKLSARQIAEQSMEIAPASASTPMTTSPTRSLPNGHLSSRPVRGRGTYPRRAHPPRNRARAGQARGGAGRRQARGGHRAAQPHSPPETAARDGRRGDAQEHPHDRSHRRRQDRDRAASGAAGQFAVPEGGGQQVHRSRLRGPRRGIHDPRPGGYRHRHGARRTPRRGCRPRRSQRRR